MKKALLKGLSFALMIAMTLSVLVSLTGCSGANDKVLNVYNVGDYIDMDILESFTKETGIKVNYSTYSSNEEMYAKIRSGAGNYDIIVPSDYMIERLIREDLIDTIDHSLVPNAEKLFDHFKNSDYDPENKHSIPYMWGTVGILYNTTLVDTEIDSWDDLWDPHYAGKILMYDSSRDSLMVSLLRLGYDVNTRDESQIEEATQALIQQKKDGLVLAYVTDECKDKMVAGEAAMAVVYSGDALLTFDETDDLDYCIPKEGSNYWIDALCIPKNSKHKANAHKFIDYLCSPEIAQKNVEYIGYSTPLESAYELLDDEMKENKVAYPDQEDLDRCVIYHDLGDFNSVYDNAWIQVKAN